MHENKEPGDDSELPTKELQENNTKTPRNYQALRQRTNGNWRRILPLFGAGDEYLTGSHVPCPACGGRDRFRFDDQEGRGTFFCRNCGAGDGFRLVQLVNRWTAVRALREVAAYVESEGLQSNPNSIMTARQRNRAESSEETSAKNREKYRAIYAGTQELTPGCPGWVYLTKTRGIPLASIPAVIRFHPALTYWETGADKKPRNRGKHPALVILVSDKNGQPAGLRFIYLDENGTKANFPEVKKMRTLAPGATVGGAVRLHSPAEHLAVCEGVETGLAINARHGLPVWAAGAADFLSSMVIPETVRTVTIFGDNDLNLCGQQAAIRLAERLDREGKHVDICITPEPGTDWLDQFYGDSR